MDKAWVPYCVEHAVWLAVDSWDTEYRPRTARAEDTETHWDD